MSASSTSLCYLNGDINSLEQTRVSVLDRGFLLGDGVFEVIAWHSGQPFRFTQHMARLERSLTDARIPRTRTPEEWLRIALNLAERSAEQAPGGAIGDRMIYLQITRGTGDRHAPLTSAGRPTELMMIEPLAPVSAAVRTLGVVCVTSDSLRGDRAHTGSTSRLGMLLARQLSADVGAVETILFCNGTLSGATASDVWIVKNGTVIGPARDASEPDILRCDPVEDLCREVGIPCTVRPVDRADVFSADELLLSSIEHQIIAVTVLDSAAIGGGHPGPITQRLQQLYQLAIHPPPSAPI